VFIASKIYRVDCAHSMVTLPLLIIAQVFERDVDFAAAADVFPPDKFNAGVMLLKPNKVSSAAKSALFHCYLVDCSDLQQL
jgi:hypothetical protein